MSNATPSRSGQALASGDAKALFLKVFSGEVLTVFEAENVTKGKVMERTITAGKSAQFPVMGRAAAEYHVPGNEILGGSIKHNEKVITIDGQLISPVFIAEIDEAMNHYDVRSHYSTEVGRTLAQRWDKHALQVGVLAARATANIPGQSADGSVITEGSAGAWNTADTLAGAFYQAAQALDEKNVPEADRFAYLPPAQYYKLLESDKVISRDFNAGNGDYAKAKIFEVAGIQIIKTNNVPSTNVTGTGVDAGGTDAKYAGDFTKTKGLIMHKSAVGTVQLMNLATRADYDPRRLGTQVVSKYAVGHGVLRPEAAVELAGF